MSKAEMDEIAQRMLIEVARLGYTAGWSKKLWDISCKKVWQAAAVDLYNRVDKRQAKRT